MMADVAMYDALIGCSIIEWFTSFLVKSYEKIRVRGAPSLIDVCTLVEF